MKVKVSNLNTPKGKSAPNQFIIIEENNVYFQSYETIIAKENNNRIELDEEKYNYSRTTLRYLYQFLGIDGKEFRKNLKEGKYILTNLN